MSEYGTTHASEGHVPWLRRASVLLTAAAVAVSVGSCSPQQNGGGAGGGGGDARVQRAACPRPPIPIAPQPGFNQQEQEIRTLRILAFQNDFFAQIKLGRRYGAERAVDKNIADPIESAVWWTMALANPEGYAPTNGAKKTGLFAGLGGGSSYDDCRAWERKNAYQKLDELLSQMTTEERDAVRDRVIYVQSTLGADGFRTLARIYDTNYGPYGEPADNAQALEAQGRGRGDKRGAAGLTAATTLFTRSDVDAYLYNYLAMRTGDVSAYVLIKDFERANPRRAQAADFVDAKANRWVAPFLFYPPTAAANGVPHSDESRPRNDAAELALARIDEVPDAHVLRAMKFLGLLQAVPDSTKKLTKEEIERLEAVLGRPRVGSLEPIERVRAIQYAAMRGDDKSQLAYSVMSVEGIGVPADYARGYDMVLKARDRGSGEAQYIIATYLGLGVPGVADQNLAEAAVNTFGSALSGFKPSVTRLQAVLRQVSRSPNEPPR